VAGEAVSPFGSKSAVVSPKSGLWVGVPDCVCLGEAVIVTVLLSSPTRVVSSQSLTPFRSVKNCRSGCFFFQFVHHGGFDFYFYFFEKNLASADRYLHGII